MDDKKEIINIATQKGCRCDFCHEVMEPHKFEIERKTRQDGSNTESIDNLMLICPNCNRRIHENEKNRLAGSGIGGAMLGASLAGPVGAIIGGVFGLFMGDSVNKTKKGNIDG